VANSNPRSAVREHGAARFALLAPAARSHG